MGVHPDEPDAKVKFLAAEALRGAGGMLLDMDGNRFCNELGRRDYVTGMMWKNKGLTLGSTTGFFLCLNGRASKEIEWHCKHYKGRGIMKSYKNMGEFAKEYNIPLANIDATFKEYNMLADKQTNDPEGGPYEAYGGGKSWDKWGKKFFHNLPMEVSDAFHVAIVTPVIHYCMGGLKINGGGECLAADDRIIGGLYRRGGGRWHSRQQPPRWQLASGLRCVRSRVRPKCRAVFHGPEHQVHRVHEGGQRSRIQALKSSICAGT